MTKRETKVDERRFYCIFVVVIAIAACGACSLWTPNSRSADEAQGKSSHAVKERSPEKKAEAAEDAAFAAYARKYMAEKKGILRDVVYPCPNENGTLLGLVTRDGVVRSPPQFLCVSSFSEGLARCLRADNLKCGFIDTQGRVVVPFKFDHAEPFSEGFAAVEGEDAIGVSRYGFIDRKGRLVIPFKYDMPSTFNDGIARTTYIAGTRSDDKFPDLQDRFIDCRDNLVVAPDVMKRFEFDLSDASGGLFRISVVQPSDEPAVQGASGYVRRLSGMVDRRGRIVIEPKYDHDSLSTFREGLAAAAKSGKYGFINRRGDVVIDFRFAGAGLFSSGIAPAKAVTKLGYAYGYIDKSGDWVIQPRFQYVWGFSEGVAAVQIRGKVGFIDYTGRFVIPAKFAWCNDSYHEGFAEVVEFSGDERIVDIHGNLFSCHTGPPGRRRSLYNDLQGVTENQVVTHLGKPNKIVEYDIPTTNVSLSGRKLEGYIIAEYIPTKYQNGKLRRLQYQRNGSPYSAWLREVEPGKWYCIANGPDSFVE
jgi:hypothetical protein